MVEADDVATCGGFLPERCVEEEGGESEVSNLETQMAVRGEGEQVEGPLAAASATQFGLASGEECGDQVETALAAASATQFASTCPTREEENHQNEAKLDEHVRITQTQENEHVVAEFGVDLGLDNGETKPNSEGDSGGVEGTVREPEVGSAAGVPVRVEKRSKKGEERRLRKEMWRRRWLGGNGTRARQIERNWRRRASRRAARTTVGEARLREIKGGRPMGGR